LLQRQVSQAAAKEARETDADVARLAKKLGIYVPADEVLFFPTLPLRVDSVRARRGDAIAGRVMTVSNSTLAVDSSLSLNDAKLVRPGSVVKIEEPDLGVKTTGKVTQVAHSPGTHKVDPGRVYLEVTPGTAPAQLVGASVKLTIAVRSTRKAVLAVPVTALSVGADGGSRLQVQRPNGRTEYVSVSPGLAAQGLVEIRPSGGELRPGDLVVVGERGALSGGTSDLGQGIGATGPSEKSIEKPPGESPKGTTRSGTSGEGNGTTGGNTTEKPTPKGGRGGTSSGTSTGTTP
jgi:hypothetical protein